MIFNSFSRCSPNIGFSNPQSNYNLSFLLIVSHPCLVIFLGILDTVQNE